MKPEDLLVLEHFYQRIAEKLGIVAFLIITCFGGTLVFLSAVASASFLMGFVLMFAGVFAMISISQAWTGRNNETRRKIRLLQPIKTIRW